jgi:glycosyltransferase involved in cell wall biosynthesis
LDTSVFHPDAALNYSAYQKKDVGSKEISSSIGEFDHIIPDIRQLAGKGSEKGPILIYCGRLAIEKNIYFLVHAMKNPLFSDATLVLVGDGPIRKELEELCCSIVGADFVFSNQAQRVNIDLYRILMN